MFPAVPRPVRLQAWLLLLRTRKGARDSLIHEGVQYLYQPREGGLLPFLSEDNSRADEEIGDGFNSMRGKKQIRYHVSHQYCQVVDSLSHNSQQ